MPRRSSASARARTGRLARGCRYRSLSSHPKLGGYALAVERRWHAVAGVRRQAQRREGLERLRAALDPIPNTSLALVGEGPRRAALTLARAGRRGSASGGAEAPLRRRRGSLHGRATRPGAGCRVCIRRPVCLPIRVRHVRTRATRGDGLRLPRGRRARGWRSGCSAPWTGRSPLEGWR